MYQYCYFTQCYCLSLLLARRSFSQLFIQIWKIDIHNSIKKTYSNYLCYLPGLCPTGTYYDYDLDDCQECPIGTYQDNEHQYECIPCDDGYSTRTEGSRRAENCTSIFFYILACTE